MGLQVVLLMLTNIHFWMIAAEDGNPFSFFFLCYLQFAVWRLNGHTWPLSTSACQQTCLKYFISQHSACCVQGSDALDTLLCSLWQISGDADSEVKISRPWHWHEVYVAQTLLLLCYCELEGIFQRWTGKCWRSVYLLSFLLPRYFFTALILAGSSWCLHAWSCCYCCATRQVWCLSVRYLSIMWLFQICIGLLPQRSLPAIRIGLSSFSCLCQLS